MNIRKVKIYGTGKYLPGRPISDLEMDDRLGVSRGWTRRVTDIVSRHYAGEDDTASAMGAKAAQAALQAANLKFTDMDCLVGASGTKEQALPCSAVFIQRELGMEQSGVPAFDIDSTCLSFLAALDAMSCMIAAGRYRYVLIVTSEIASVGLDWRHKESAALFGDGAAAVVLGPAEDGEPSAIVGASMRTYSAGAAFSEIRAGGTRRHPNGYRPAAADDYLFSMDGPAIYKMASRLLPDFTEELLQSAGTVMSDLKAVIPHQGSAMAVRLMRKKLGIAERQLVYITPNHGNTIAASLPMGLHEAIRTGRIERGDRVLLIGTAAGLTLGGLILDY
ncbi:beta-ketoacyl-ACP synthase III [Paenibacillus urinalis]|uniref:Beta-ketoacyl-ACP synthase III n=1 Tax=Paenibacillus urinalis TaxID=521520 RepID=A0AAX3N8A2_9BACL|nr:beta-ketoacyl-ACP synthase III [Paenibacillus urinalis]WDH85294.1 beta-ketoacyl-ACP synthase III [Paenibacillus urinalis]WDI02095.1 beta-ketoacyl-ACP synthase III [Paenibacillus urinalis]